MAFGFVVALLLAAVQAAGALIDLQVGTSAGAVFDPFSGNGAAPIGRFQQIMAMAILFAINGHVLVVRGFLRSVEAVPMGGIAFDRLGQILLQALTTMFVATIEIGLPILAALFCAEVALGLLGEGGPPAEHPHGRLRGEDLAAFALLAATLVLLPGSVGSLLEQALRLVEQIYVR